MVIFALVEIFNIAAIRTLLVGIPESAGLLVFGVGLVLTAVFIRRLLGRKTEEEADKTFGKEV